MTLESSTGRLELSGQTNLRDLIRQEIHDVMVSEVLTDYVSSESVLPRKIRGLGADGSMGDVLSLQEDAESNVVATWTKASIAGNVPKAYVYLNNPQSIPSGSGTVTETVVDWEATLYDTVDPDDPSIVHWDSGDPGWLEIQEDGVYLALSNIVHASGTAGTMRRARMFWKQPSVAEIRVAAYTRNPPGATGFAWQCQLIWFAALTAGDKIRVKVNQDQGSPQNILAGIDRSFFTITKLSD